MNIPIYRAKKLNSDEWVDGYYVPFCSADGVINYDADYIYYKDYFNTNEPNLGFYWTNSVIDPNTLAIHFDKKDKNKKSVFFSLRDNGYGGDLVSYGTNKYYAIYNKMKDKLEFVAIDDELQRLNTTANVEVIGIHKG